MKLSINLALDKKEMNPDWRRAILSLIKHLLQEEAPELYEEYYGEYKTNMKKFAYSMILPGAKFTETAILLDKNEAYLYITSTDKKIMMYFHNAFLKNKGKRYPLQNGNSMTVTGIKLLQTPAIEENEIIVKMVSPIIAREHSRDNVDRCYYYDEEKFAHTLEQTIRMQLNCDNVPQVEPVKGKRVVVKAFGGSIPCNLGIYKITGKPSQLEELYLNGIGSRASAGFGVFQIIG